MPLFFATKLVFSHGQRAQSPFTHNDPPLGFYLAATVLPVGLGNIWKFSAYNGLGCMAAALFRPGVFCCVLR